MIRGYPDVFRGGYLMMGGWFYHTWYAGDPAEAHDPEAKAGWAADVDFMEPKWKEPPERAKREMRIGKLRGDRDEMFGGTMKDDRVQYEGLVLDGFVRASFIEAAGLAHKPPDAKTFEQGLEAMDAPAKTPPSTRPTKDANPSASQVAQAQRMLASSYYSEKRREMVLRILQDYPTTPAAVKAGEILKKLDEQAKKLGKK